MAKQTLSFQNGYMQHLGIVSEDLYEYQATSEQNLKAFFFALHLTVLYLMFLKDHKRKCCPENKKSRQMVPDTITRLQKAL